jgi:glycosyltransferase involved in cell wall biosynthesis
MPVYNTPPAVLDAAIKSVRRQIYPDWQLCIADDASSSPGIRDILERHAAEDDRISVRFLTARGNIVAATNAALEMAAGEFVALFDHDDILPAHSLYWVVDAINRRPDACIIYSDEDKIDADGKRYDPYFKGDFNIDLLRAQNMISHLGVYRRELAVAIGGFRAGFDGAQDHDFVLRAIEQVRRDQIVHVPRILYHWRAIQGRSPRRSPPDTVRSSTTCGGSAPPPPSSPHPNRPSTTACGIPCPPARRSPRS